MPFPLMLLLLPLTSALGRIFVSAGVASIVYYFITSTVTPMMDLLSDRILSATGELTSIGGYASLAVIYLDFAQLISLVLAAGSAVLTLKVLSVAIRAFGISTG